MAEKSPGKNYVLVNCPDCQGSGRVESSDCARCSGVGVFAWLDGDFITWKEKIVNGDIFSDLVY